MNALIMNNWDKVVTAARVLFRKELHPYFFLKGEPPVSAGYPALIKAYNAGQMRHLIVSRTDRKFYDFLENKVYGTIDEWAGDLDNVMFGENRINKDGSQDYIPLRDLIGHLSIQI